MIKLSGITKTYQGSAGQVQALKGIDLKIEQGEIFGVIGKSGAGKSTLIRCINMLEQPSTGSVTVDNQELTTMNEQDLRNMRKKIGMIFQHFNLLSSRTVYDNVAFPLELAGKSKAEIAADVLPLLELVGLTDKKDQYPSQLSGGQKQRVGIARALASKPLVLLCDEATSALDPQTTKSILDLLKSINEKLKLTIVLITHEMQVIKEICHHVAVIEGGLIIEQGPVLDIFTKPKSATTREFIRAIINYDLPDIFLDTSFSDTPLPDGNLVLRLSFIGHAAGEPIIAGMIRRFNVDTSILYGNIDHIQSTPFGTLLVELSGEQQNIESALNYLRAKDLGIEVIGYVARNARAAG
ncbi:D-methionine transport system ATP-binding protein [Anaerospora hongkongensis]|uniref:D-methionine transport system ATP-binding protein n=1 Tax=Anaerospora hongkongensis TaxID=244830 RepID=A0A4R1Q4D4_9FIRM|nr:methionine ABC transporter ATP-binding protein [Anaerospora hongkongensis]TCL39127.1 D-methionine transport system ATP-binding protein [Anaerospora hongkongensis]